MRAALLGMSAAIAFTTPATAAPASESTSTSAPASAPASASVDADADVNFTQEGIREAREAERYWTPERIRGAVAIDAKGQEVKGNSATGDEARPGGRQKRSLRAPSRPTAEGIASVGVFLIRGGDGEATSDQFCSASAVASPTKSLVITAAHCLKGDRSYRSIAFVPGYRAGAAKAGQVGETPYGIFPMQPGKVWIDGRYLRPTPSDDVDFAFLRVGPNARGQLLEDAIGRGNELTSVGSAHLARKKVTVAGYPGGTRTPLQCTNDTTAFQGRFMEIRCDGFRAGVSGGPFLENFDGRRGKLVGVIGGYKTGGLYDHISYTSQFDDDVFRLYRKAVGDAPPDKGSVLGDAQSWQHAKAMTAGRFHTTSARDTSARDTSVNDGVSDLIVRRDNGEVSLYRGNGKFGFAKEVRLIGPNGTWKHAEVITAGDFTGSATSDLFVRWSDGELTLYKDVDEHTKLRDEIQLRRPNSLWKNAKAVTAGHYTGAGTRADDLVVRWSDGELTLYPDVDEKGTHTERRLTAPNKTWTHARDISSGSFTGSATATGQDLFVRWSDGEVSVYENIAAKSLKSEHRLRPAGSPWRQATLTTVGAFGGGSAREDDVIVRWSTGKLSVNADTTPASLSREHTLVPNPGG
ncbi:trypsin-like serine peptidase [Actinomycetota bacterium Odt1-20B]